MTISENDFVSMGILTLALHLIVYLLALRSRLRTEAAIFVYHFVPTVILFVCSVIFFVISMTEERIASAITLISLNGIYSLTFLELWTLSQISYSRELLIKAKANKFLSTSSHVDELARLGDRKRSERLQSLCDLGLLLPTDDGWKLSTRGKLIAGLLQLLNWLPNLKSRG